MNKLIELQPIIGVALLVAAILLSIYDPGLISNIIFYKILLVGNFYVKTYHIIWLIVMIEMAMQLTPHARHFMASGKLFAKYYSKNTSKVSARKAKLKKYTKKMNFGALKVAVLWTLVTGAIGISYYSGILPAIGVFIIVILFYFLDGLFQMVFCPFRELLIHNKCCNTCRIYRWGPLMTVIPLIFIPSFWTYSVIALTAIVAMQWEYMHYIHPERFFELCNKNLLCKNCTKKGVRCPKE